MNCSILARFENKGTIYKYRKGATARIKDLDEHTRNKVMGHARGQTFAHYISNLVTEDTQSMFMQTPTRNALLSLSAHASITRDPSAPQELTDKQAKVVEADELIQNCLSDQASDKRFNEFQRLGNKVKARRRRLYHKALLAIRHEFFKQVGNRIIESNAAGKPIKYMPNTSGVQPERLALAALEFQNRDVNEIDDDQLIKDRIQSLELRLELNKLRMPVGIQPHIRSQEKKTQQLVNEDGAKLKDRRGGQSLQCPICAYNPTAI
ncbi:hypothetical protein N7486_001864 [Penicillium sp. IBT 16267x]|nr:hypothetical protein N7486_001864 [Penicillium sp. IBT 16267x]